jgi:hypothetical protein
MSGGMEFFFEKWRAERWLIPEIINHISRLQSLTHPFYAYTTAWANAPHTIGIHAIRYVTSGRKYTAWGC